MAIQIFKTSKINGARMQGSPPLFRFCPFRTERSCGRFRYLREHDSDRVSPQTLRSGIRPRENSAALPKIPSHHPAATGGYGGCSRSPRIAPLFP